MTTLQKIGTYVADPVLSERTADRLGLHALDVLGALLAGSRTSEAAELSQLSSATNSLSAWGHGPLDKVALWVATARLSEIDDIHLPSCTTPGAIVVPTALTIAAALGTVPARRFGRALKAGYGVMSWLGTAFQGPTILYRGIWPTYLIAPIAAAAVAAVLLDLDEARSTDAVALACSRISGGPGAPGAPAARWYLAGEATRAGVAAALAAASGIGGDPALLDGSWLHQVHGVQADAAALALPLPADGATSAISMKPVCSARQAQAAIDGFRQLLSSGLDPAAIEGVSVAVPPSYAAMIGHQRIASRTDRITGVAYQLALAAFRPDDLTDIERGPVHDQRIAAFMPRVGTVEDTSLQVHYPRHWPARVELRTQSGQVLQVTVVEAPGDPERPLDPGEIVGKFRRLTGGMLDQDAARQLERAALRATADDAALVALVAQMQRHC